jgi:hypothetical protein
VDVIVRRRQTRLGVYDAMGSHPGLDDSGAFDVKTDQADGGECEEGFVGSADGDAG